jgi:ubiquinone/menaquinone biosynthesis C-methylase UbiE
MTTQHQRIRQEFDRQAARFDNPQHSAGNRDQLEWIIGNLDLPTDGILLDVATGTGLVARAAAPHVRRVVGVDMTPNMLHQGYAEMERAGLSNILLVQGLAETLPYADNTFDQVVSRFSVHHFENPLIQLREMVRVCRTGAQVAIIDLVLPEDSALAARSNEIEIQRDPSHTRALSQSGLLALLQSAGLTIASTVSRNVEVNSTRWFELAGTPSTQRQVILEKLRSELDGGEATGMRPFWRDQEVMFFHNWMIAVGVKSSALPFL